MYEMVIFTDGKDFDEFPHTFSESVSFPHVHWETTFEEIGQGQRGDILRDRRSHPGSLCPQRVSQRGQGWR